MFNFYHPDPASKPTWKVQNLFPTLRKLQIRVSIFNFVPFSFFLFCPNSNSLWFAKFLLPFSSNSNPFATMKHQKPRDEENRGKNNGSNSIKMNNNNNMKKKKRLGGGGLSLEAFANAKTKGDFYNPSLISTFFFFFFIYFDKVSVFFSFIKEGFVVWVFDNLCFLVIGLFISIWFIFWVILLVLFDGYEVAGLESWDCLV